MKLPKYIPDTPYDDDFFKIHSQIAETTYKTIKNEDVSKHSFTLGLFGEWGSGKSLTVKNLKKKIAPADKAIFIEFDIWKYVDASLYRSILFDLEKQLREQANAKEANQILANNFKNGYLIEGKYTLRDELNYNYEKHLPEKSNNSLLELIKRRWPALTLFLLSAVTYALIINEEKVWYRLAPLVEFIKPVKFLFPILSVFGGVEFFKEFFKKLFDDILPKNNYRIVSSPPTFAQDQFEEHFCQMINLASDNGKQKIVIVFDNIDRCELDIVYKILSGLKTFLNVPNCFYIIPCDELEIKKYLGRIQHKTSSGDTNTEIGFIDKIFHSYIRIPLLQENDRTAFIEHCITNAELDLSLENKNKIVQILYYAYKGNTPRQIKRFFNDFISYLRLALEIDPKEDFLLDDIGMFTFMITIKQKWPEVEELLIRHPNFFNEYFDSKPLEKINPDFNLYLNDCIKWIDLEKNVLNYVYLKEVKQSGIIIQKVLQENYEDFLVNETFIKEIDAAIAEYLRMQYWVFAEKAIEKVKNILGQEFQKKENTFQTTKLFHCYWKHLVNYDKATHKPPAPSFILRHAEFLSKNISIINKLERNIVSGAQAYCLGVIKQEGYNETTKNLFEALLKTFNPALVKQHFDSIPEDKIAAHQLFISSISQKEVVNFVPASYLNKLVNALNFNEQSNNTLNTLEHIGKVLLPVEVSNTLASKIATTISVIWNHAAAHVADPFIARAMPLCKRENFESFKASFDKHMVHRINTLLPRGQRTIAMDYLKEILFLVNNEPHINQIKTNLKNKSDVNQWGALANFNTLIAKFSSPQLQLLINEKVFQPEIVEMMRVHKKGDIFYKLLETKFINKNFEFVVLNDLSLVLPLLTEINSRRDKNNSEADKVEDNLYDFFIKNNKNAFLESYATTLNLLVQNKIREQYVEECMDYFMGNLASSIPKVIELLNNVTIQGNKDLLGKIYEKNKINIVNSNNGDLFENLYGLLPESKKHEYLKRHFEKINMELSASKPADGMITKAIEKLSPAFVKENKKQIEDMVIELLEASRHENENKIGVLLIEKGKLKLSKSVSEKIELLTQHPSKSKEFKDLLSSLN